MVGPKVWDTSVEGRAVVPDGDTVGLPMKADLVLELDGDEVVDVVKNPPGLLGSDLVNLAGKDRVGVDRLPAGDRVGTDDWVDRVVELAKGLEAVVGDLDLEDVGTVGGSQALKQVLDGLRKIVIELVAVGPDGVAARLGDLLKLEDRVRCWVGVEGHVRVPRVVGVEATWRAIKFVGRRAINIIRSGSRRREK